MGKMRTEQDSTDRLKQGFYIFESTKMSHTLGGDMFGALDLEIL